MDGRGTLKMMGASEKWWGHLKNGGGTCGGIPKIIMIHRIDRYFTT